MKHRKPDWFLSFVVVESINVALFPIDMLRYATCAPATERDADEIEKDERVPPGDDGRRVLLARFSVSPELLTAGSPVTKRFEWFGWRVVGAFYSEDRERAEARRNEMVR